MDTDVEKMAFVIQLLWILQIPFHGWLNPQKAENPRSQSTYCPVLNSEKPTIWLHLAEIQLLQITELWLFSNQNFITTKDSVEQIRTDDGAITGIMSSLSSTQEFSPHGKKKAPRWEGNIHMMASSFLITQSILHYQGWICCYNWNPTRGH